MHLRAVELISFPGDLQRGISANLENEEGQKLQCEETSDEGAMPSAYSAFVDQQNNGAGDDFSDISSM